MLAAIGAFMNAAAYLTQNRHAAIALFSFDYFKHCFAALIIRPAPKVMNHIYHFIFLIV